MKTNYSATIGNTGGVSRPQTGSQLRRSGAHRSANRGNASTAGPRRQSWATIVILMSTQDNSRHGQCTSEAQHPLRSHPYVNYFASCPSIVADSFHQTDALQDDCSNLRPSVYRDEDAGKRKRPETGDVSTRPRQWPRVEQVVEEAQHMQTNIRDLNQDSSIYFYPSSSDVPRRDLPIYGLPKKQENELSSAITNFRSENQPQSFANKVWKILSFFQAQTQPEVLGEGKELMDTTSQRYYPVPSAESSKAPVAIQRPKLSRGEAYDGLVLTDIPHLTDVLSRDGDGSRIPTFIYAHRKLVHSDLRQDKKPIPRDGAQQEGKLNLSYHVLIAPKNTVTREVIPVTVEELEVFEPAERPPLRRQQVHSHLPHDYPITDERPGSQGSRKKHPFFQEPSRNSSMNAASLHELAPSMRSPGLRRKYSKDIPRKRVFSSPAMPPKQSSLGRRGSYLEGLRNSRPGKSPLHQEILPDDILSTSGSPQNYLEMDTKAPHSWSDLLPNKMRHFSFETDDMDLDSSAVEDDGQEMAPIARSQRLFSFEMEVPEISSVAVDRMKHYQAIPVADPNEALSLQSESPPELSSWPKRQSDSEPNELSPHPPYSSGYYSLALNRESSIQAQAVPHIWPSTSSSTKSSPEGKESLKSLKLFPFVRNMRNQRREYAFTRPTLAQRTNAVARTLFRGFSQKGQEIGKETLNVVAGKVSPIADAFDAKVEVQGNRLDGRTLVQAGKKHEMIAGIQKVMAQSFRGLANKLSFDRWSRLDRARGMKDVGGYMQREGSSRLLAERATVIRNYDDF
ncbi:MAG: hypothetical protein MMC33_002946 [Icmadophila ericetorum]|nr:hypothetical protein [Icmadophila ericetorum]